MLMTLIRKLVNKKFVNRAVDVVLMVEDGPSIAQGGLAKEKTKIFTLANRNTGAMIQLDQAMFEFIYNEAKKEMVK